ncbi:PopZ family protein [Microvirga antarctica]|uniref:PopZ family protein n=1 Tax=Microvirga antarctica TaxID=2819233 RepID=UPI001FEA8E62|nr:DUF2497 domain-containing protein [Microvirga antarctica]
MEEILASIRRIIADDQEVLRGAERDQPQTGAVRTVVERSERRAESTPPPERRPFVADLSERQVESVPASPPDESADELELVTYHDEEEDDLPVAPRLRDDVDFAGAHGADTLLSSAANASVSDAFTRLGSTLMPAHPQTLDDLMKDLLRPMLKSWLDAHLPALVERLVQAEIERISRGRL